MMLRLCVTGVTVVALTAGCGGSKSSAERVPRTVSLAILSYEGPAVGRDAATRSWTRTLQGSELTDLISALNGLQVGHRTPDLCPQSPPEQAEALLEYGGHQVIFTDDLSGCGQVTVTSDGRPQPDLSGGGDAPFAAIARQLANRP